MKLKRLFNKVMLVSILLLSGFTALAEESLGKSKSATCSVCHGTKGISLDPMTPNLAGQDADYIVHQLEAFKSGTRKSAVMKSISKSLTNNEMIALANFYSSLPFKNMEEKGDSSLIAKGAAKYSLCWSCHGEKGEGPGSYPSIAGQHPQYTIQQLQHFKDGSRINPVMKSLVDILSTDDIEALSAYIATLKH